jgi:hypothetical protein
MNSEESGRVNRCHEISRARFEMFSAMKIKFYAFWVVTTCSVVVGIEPEDGSTKVLRNIGILSQHYIASQPRKPRP